jgi:hypothetical protein
MIWEKINESPVGYEPVYSVIETTTGRRIAENLELDEAIYIENVKLLYFWSKKSINFLDKYYMADKSSSKEDLEKINEILTSLEMLHKRIEDEKKGN